MCSRLSLVWTLVVCLTLLASLSGLADAVQYTIDMPIGHRRCFHFETRDTGGKVALYYAALGGGDKPLPFSVTAPDHVDIVSVDDKRSGDYVFPLQQQGKYDTCFENKSNVQMMVDVDFIIEDKNGLVRHLKDELTHHNAKPPHDVHNSAAIDNAIFKIQGGLHSAARNLKYIKTREARSMETVTSTESRIFWFAILESVLIVSIAALQVFAVRKLFSVPKAKGRV